MLVAGSIGGLYSCQKKLQEAPSPAFAPSPVEAVRSAFNAAGHDRALTQTFGDSAQLRWEPDWHAACRKKSATGVTYTYVPLTPSLLTAGTQRPVAGFHIVGTRRFILAKHVGQALEFSLATYTVAQTPTASGKRQALVEVAGQPFVFASFSGSLTQQGLTVRERAFYTYQNGQLLKQRQTSPAPGQRVNATSSFDCVTVYTCYWQAYCPDGRGNVATYGTVIQSTDGCNEPGYEACGISVWGIGWNSIGSDIQEYCVHVDDPPMPDTSDPGNDGSNNPTTLGNSNPCNTLRTLGTDAGFNQLLGDLKAKTALDHEEGYTYSKTGNAVTDASLQQGSTGGAGINLQVNGQIDGYMHTHHSGLLSVFSASDMRAVYELYKSNHIRDAATFSAQVITANGNT